MTYRLLALDLDGTVIGDDLVIQPAVRDALRRSEAAGVSVTLATGRAFDSALPFAEELGITVPLICYQGGLIKSPVDGEVWHEATFSRSLGLELIRWTAARMQQGGHRLDSSQAQATFKDFQFVKGRIDLALFVSGIMYLESMEQGREFLATYFGQRIQFVSDLSEALVEDPNKAMFIAHPETCDMLIPELKSTFAGRLRIVRSHPLFVEATPPHVSKGDGLAHLSARLGVPRSATIAVGDNENDLSMVEWAGLGIAMANATPQVKAAADWIAPSVADGGVAAVVDRFIVRDGHEVHGSE